jgi:hypothetical protein
MRGVTPRWVIDVIRSGHMQDGMCVADLSIRAWQRGTASAVFNRPRPGVKFLRFF